MNKDISKMKRIVIKVGTSTITHHKTGLLNIRRMEQLVKTIADLKNMGYEILLVSSGSIGLGVGKLGLSERPKDTPGKQACAAVGQCELMYIYDKMFSEYGINVAQMLLTKYVLLEDRKVNVMNACQRLIDQGVIPIINENDTVAIDEVQLEVGENDTLAAIVASISDSDLLIIMTDIDGLYTEDPKTHPDAHIIHYVDHIDKDMREHAGGSGSKFGSGGMLTKLNAVNIAFEHDIDVVILNGRDPKILYDLFDNKPVGTLFSSSLNKK
jgi:glutamate 5-kinase